MRPANITGAMTGQIHRPVADMQSSSETASTIVPSAIECDILASAQGVFFPNHTSAPEPGCMDATPSLSCVAALS
jgi:hypothetical protein